MTVDETDKNDTSYSDEYDWETVEECRRFEKRMDESRKKESGKENLAMHDLYRKTSLYFIRGERYIVKDDVIRERKQRKNHPDEYDRKLEKAQPRFNALCLVCRSDMDMVEKTMHGEGKDERVLFYFKCPSCGSVRRFFKDGTEHRVEARPCPKCQTSLEKKSSREGSKLIDSYTCSGCGYTEDDIIDLDERLVEKPKFDKDFPKDREKYCMTEKEGREYSAGAYHRQVWEKDHGEKFSVENVAVEEAVKQLKILNIIQVQELLAPVLKENGLVDLVFSKPEMLRGTVMLAYTAQDASTVRSKENAGREIKQLIDKTLEETNWRTTSEDISYNLGLIGGRIRGSDKENDLKELSRSRIRKSDDL